MSSNSPYNPECPRTQDPVASVSPVLVWRVACSTTPGFIVSGISLGQGSPVFRYESIGKTCHQTPPPRISLSTNQTLRSLKWQGVIQPFLPLKTRPQLAYAPNVAHTTGLHLSIKAKARTEPLERAFRLEIKCA